MADSNPSSTDKILSTALHHIDLENEECSAMSAVLAQSDMESYLKDLLKEIGSREQRRAFDFDRQSTEFYNCLLSFVQQKKILGNSNSENIAQRLLQKEIQTDAQYGHLGAGNRHVKRGSFLQFLFLENNITHYLGVKVEHQSFLDESDFKRKIGLSIENKIYKACKVSFDSSGLPDSILLFDTNSKPATYWWREFLELKEKRNDAFNTRIAVTEVVKVLNGIKKKFPVDHTILRNAAIAAFKKTGSMKFDNFISANFENYNPTDQALKERLPTLIAELKGLPEKKKFDSLFDLVPSEVMFNKKKIQLTKEISISYDEGITDLDTKIWSEIRAGQKFVIIKATEGFDNFRLK